MDGVHPGSVRESFLTFGTRIIETMHTLYEWSAQRACGWSLITYK